MPKSQKTAMVLPFWLHKGAPCDHRHIAL